MPSKTPDSELQQRIEYVVFTLDEDLSPAHFLAVGEREEASEAMDKWWKAFYTGEKDKPKNYNGVSMRPVADFERWKEGENAE